MREANMQSSERKTDRRMGQTGRKLDSQINRSS